MRRGIGRDTDQQQVRGGSRERCVWRSHAASMGTCRVPPPAGTVSGHVQQLRSEKNTLPPNGKVWVTKATDVVAEGRGV